MEVSGQLHASAALHLEKEPWYSPVGGCLDPRAGLDAVAKKKIPTPSGNRTPVVQPVTQSLFLDAY